MGPLLTVNELPELPDQTGRLSPPEDLISWAEQVTGFVTPGRLEESTLTEALAGLFASQMDEANEAA